MTREEKARIELYIECTGRIIKITDRKCLAGVGKRIWSRPEAESDKVALFLCNLTNPMHFQNAKTNLFLCKNKPHAFPKCKDKLVCKKKKKK
jgi:hypothetical protein